MALVSYVIGHISYVPHVYLWDAQSVHMGYLLVVHCLRNVLYGQPNSTR
jgi:hypothetical protein